MAIFEPPIILRKNPVKNSYIKVEICLQKKARGAQILRYFRYKKGNNYKNFSLNRIQTQKVCCNNESLARHYLTETLFAILERTNNDSINGLRNPNFEIYKTHRETEDSHVL